jgi:dihydroorotate dehydrogenase (fumarate)
MKPSGGIMNLETDYLGLHLRTPLVASPSPLTGTLEGMRKLEGFGASAVVTPSVFEEQIRHQFNDPSWSLKYGIRPYPPSLSYLPNEEDFPATPEQRLEIINEASTTLSIPVIASLAGSSPGDWIEFGRELQGAGADAIELSIYHVPTDTEHSAAEIEADQVEMVCRLRRVISIPLAVKVSPFITSLPHLASRLVDAGADGIVLFNRLFSADIDLEHMELSRRIHLTTSRDIGMPLRWIAILCGQVHASLAASSGVHSGIDALRLIAAGADVAMLCSSLLMNGPEHLMIIERQMIGWLEAHGHTSLHEVRGRVSVQTWPDRSALERANYVWAIGNLKGAAQRVPMEL